MTVSWSTQTPNRAVQRGGAASPGFVLPVCFRAEYVVPARIKSLEKLGWVAEALAQRADVEIVEPRTVVDRESLYQLHDPKYVDAFLDGEGSLARSQNLAWSTRLRDAVLAALGGQLEAAELALRYGVSANLAQGFHHARYSRGGGYCTFNGLAMIAAAYPALKVAVLDCDEHGGNGTAEFSECLDNLFSVSIHGEGSSFGCRAGERSVAISLPALESSFAPYRSALDQAFAFLDNIGPDLVVYQAGVDCHRDDPLGSIGLSTRQLAFRDRAVFRWAQERQVPLLFLLAGGYLERSRVVSLHLQTIDCCVRVFATPRR